MRLTSADVKSEAARLGFIACGITTLDPTPHAAELDHWLSSGMAGTMRYLHRQARKRKHPALADKTAKRAVVVLDNYYSERGVAQGGPKVASYAQGEDYHIVTINRLEVLAGFLRRNGAVAARPYVDTGPIAERELAQRAGLGWIGKNTMLIRPSAGSWFFIGEVLTDLPLEPDAPFATDQCGSCTRCLDACPTAAFPAARVLDATRCISYITIEHKAPIPPPIAEHLSGWAFGCDICNQVCPWNVRFSAATTIAAFRPRETLADADEDYFERLDEEEFARKFGDTPLARPGLERMRRNWKAAWKSLRRNP